MKCILYILILIPSFMFGQLSTNISMSPTQLVQNVLLGQGVVISSVQFTGDNVAIGEFTSGPTSLGGMTHGIVMTTGTVLNSVSGPQGPNDEGGSGTDNNGGSSGLLNGLIGGGSNTFNAATLEFNFVATGDVVSFKYVFGSEEYLEYVDAGFNDVFGLFISGPGIAGTQNIAKLPNGTPVTIDNVNNNANSAFYIDNGDGSEGPFNGSSNFIQYDGYTRILTASSNVQCGGTYHLTIAIADVGDGILDSGIFLEAESLTSIAPIDIVMQTSANYFGDPTIIAEGCTSADFTFTRTETDVAIVVPITVTGTATSGLDYTNTIPVSLNLAAGVASQTFTFDAILDAIDEGLESIILTFLVPDPCSGTIIEKEFTLQIQQVEPIQVTIENDTIFCDGVQSVVLTPVITGGLEPITYAWSTLETSPTISVSPTVTTIYSVTATDFCLNSNDTDDAEIYIPPLVPIVIQPITNISEICAYISHTIIPVASGGTGSTYNYLWKREQTPIGNQSTITLTPSATGNYTLIVSDNCGAVDSVKFIYTVITPLLIPEINTPLIVCPGDPVILTASATLGLGAYSYFWVHSSETTPVVTVNPFVTTTYTVEISDECQTYRIPISTVAPVNIPFANFSFSTSNLQMNEPIQFNNQSTNSVSYFWDLGNGQTSTDKNPVTSYSGIGTYDVTLIEIDNQGCTDTVTKTINIGYALYIPNTFTPDGNRFNNDFFAKSINIIILKVEIYNRWGEIVFETKNETDWEWDGSYKKKPCPDGIYTYKIRYKTVSAAEEFDKIGHVNLLR